MPEPSAPTAAPPGHPAGLDPERQARVDRARAAWIERLVDLTRRNPLLYFRDLVAGSLDLSQAPATALAALLRHERVLLGDLRAGAVPNEHGQAAHTEAEGLPTPRPDPRRRATDRLASVALNIHRRALLNAEERGLETLFLTLGMATWAVTDDGRPPAAPVLLLPVRLELRGRDRRFAALQRTGDVQVNSVLLHVLRQQFGIALEAQALVEAFEGDDPGEPFDPWPALALVSAAAQAVPGFAVHPRWVLANFAFQKMALVQDLREHALEFAAHDLIAALCGDAQAQAQVRAGRNSVALASLDERSPEHEYSVLPADSSQQAVIAAALAGGHSVIQGPPGTGKSQTIVNLIAECAARGLRVLFVAEKRAALDVVHARLRQAGLGHLALDLHGAELSRREIMQRLAQSLEVLHTSLPVDGEALHRRFGAARTALVEHVARLHARRPPAQASVFDLQGQILQARDSAHVHTRWRAADLQRLGPEQVEQAQALLSEAGAFDGLFTHGDPSPWTAALLADGTAVQSALDDVHALTEGLPRLRMATAAAAMRVRLPEPETLVAARQLMALLEQAHAFARRYDRALFEQDLVALVRALQPAGGWLTCAWALLTDATFRAARRRLLALRHAGPCGSRVLWQEAREALTLASAWGAHAAPGASQPSGDSDPAALLADWTRTRQRLTRLGQVLAAGVLELPDLSALLARLAALAADAHTPRRLPRLHAIEAQLEALGVAAFIAELRVQRPAPQHWPALLRAAWQRSCLEQAWTEAPELAAFDGEHHERVLADFRQLDEQRVRLAAARVARAHAERAVATMNAHPAQEQELRREAHKKTRHLPFRQLVERAPDALLALCPCWMASPLSVSQLLPAGRRYFDIVLFDEASQVLPEDAVGALLRGARAVVAGDRHQLPPTPFFAGGDDGADSSEALTTEGFESVLDLLGGLVEPWELRWHYRSADEALIAFSNREIYADSLVTFPGALPHGALRHERVTQGDEADEESSAAEVRRVVALVCEHAAQRPEETLGVIALGLRHAARLQAALDETLRDRPDLEEFFAESRRERFFVKNLERVQGDERDAIVLSIGYGKAADGRLPYRFGPLLHAGGERRLNVAITRARRRLTLVSSFGAEDMTPGRSQARGVELLRQYLAYAARGGGSAPMGAGDHGVPAPVDHVDDLTAFEQDVCGALRARGLVVRPRWGASRARVDLALEHPVRPGRFVLALECDGPAYRDTPTARDRDVLRPRQLGRLGWQHQRVWSAAWFQRREAEIERVLEAYHAAVLRADAADAGAAPPAAQSCETALDEPRPAPRPVRPPRPAVAPGRSIDAYAPSELDALVLWVRADGRLRSDDELLQCLMDELGFQKRGRRIERALRAALGRARDVG